MENGGTKVKVGKLNMVDLAGSERQKKTSTTDAPPGIVNMNDNGNDVKEFSDID